MFGTGDMAMREVPIGDIQGWVAENGDAWKHARRQIDPPLVDKKAARQVDYAVIVQLLLPPGKECLCLAAPGYADKAQIVSAGSQDVYLGGPSIVFQRARQVGCQHDVSGFQRLGDAAQRRIDLDVGIQINDPLKGIVFEEILEYIWLYSSAQLQDRVLEVKPVRPGNRQIAGEHYLKVLVLGVEVSIDLIDKYDEAPPVGMMFRN